jgi:hypothetical protein
MLKSSTISLQMRFYLFLLFFVILTFSCGERKTKPNEVKPTIEENAEDTGEILVYKPEKNMFSKQ